MTPQAVRNFPALLSILLVLALAAPERVFSQDGRYLVLFPSKITSGNYAGDVDIFSAIVGGDASLAWPAEAPHSIAAQSYREFAPVAVPDGEGGAFLVYAIEHTDTAFGGDQDIVMRRVDRFGQNMLGDSSSSVVAIARTEHLERNPHVVATSDGGLLIIYEVQYREGTPTPGDIDVAAIKVDRAGVPIWTSGVWVAHARGREHLAEAVTDGRGGAIAIIERTGHVDSVAAGDIVAVHIDSFGKTGWGASADPVAVGTSRHDEKNAAAVSDGRGGAYVAYEIAYISGSRAGDHDILAQHITSTGAREWVSESALPIVSSVPTARETNPAIVLDTGGVIVAFEMDFHSEKRPVRIIGVQRMDLGGRLTWNRGKKPEVVMVAGRAARNPRLTADFGSGAFLTFEAVDSVSGDADLYAQRFASGGDQLWANGDMPVAVFKSGDRERDMSIAPDGMGGFIAVATKEFVTLDGTRTGKIVAQRIGHDGRPAWPQLGGPLLLSNTTTYDSQPVIVAVR